MDAYTDLLIRIRTSVYRAWETQARHEGLETADYVASHVSREALPYITDRDLAAQIQADADIKKEVAGLARRLSPPHAFNPDVTLLVFRFIRQDPTLYAMYATAVGSDPMARSNPEKARLNRALGAICRTATNARSRSSSGEVTIVQVAGEICSTYTRLLPPL